MLSSANLEERRLLYAQLLEAGYDVMPVESMADAVRSLLWALARPPLVIADVHGDGQATPERVEQLLRLLPGVPLVLVVGGIEGELWEPFRPRVAALLRRPLSIGKTVDAVQRLLPPSDRGDDRGGNPAMS